MPENSELFGHSANHFALKLYARLRSQDRPNSVFSPLSIYTALCMTQAGARGATAEEMAAILEVPHAWDQEHLQLAYGEFMKSLARPEAKTYFRLDIANRLWLAQGAELREQFVQLLKTHYDSGVGSVDFRGQPEPARLEINKWVAEKTRNQIPELFLPGTISEQTLLVLANAILFIGQWARPFDPKLTRPGVFHVSAEQTAQVPMMLQRGDYHHAELKELQLLELEYAGKSASMVILLPNQGCEVKQIEELLTEQLDRWMETLRATRHGSLEVELPRFRITSRSPLVQPLKGMGLELPFSDKADFSGMCSLSHLSLSKIVHQASVEVNEEGTVATAATATVVTRGYPPEFHVDRPFLFLIRDLRTGVILFLGRVTNPLQS
ncbi:MAG: serpin family protein [Isosphaeraceae bacterium]